MNHGLVKSALARSFLLERLMRLAPFVECARSNGASDLHLEPGLPPAFRIRGQLYPNGEPITGAATAGASTMALAEIDAVNPREPVPVQVTAYVPGVAGAVHAAVAV